MAATDDRLAHLLRRAGFGANRNELAFYQDLGLGATVDLFTYYDEVPDEVDSWIGQSGFVSVTTRGGQFAPNTVINDARQRWLFRMIHSQRPLQEKMTLFWHNHFATGYSKVQGAYGAAEGTRMMAGKTADDPYKVRGQMELLREYAVGNFRDLLIEITKDLAMLVWLDGRTNVRGRPQENYARELMELFTLGVGYYTEPDVYAGARVFTGWNLRRVGARPDNTAYYEFFYNPNQHDTAAKEFSFPIYPDGGRTIPARSAADGMQDGIDLINACARHPETGRRLARKLYGFFVSELSEPDPAFIDELARLFVQGNFSLRAMLRRLFTSPQFYDPASYNAHYSWPVEFVVRAIKETGWNGFSVNDALTPLVNMGQQLFEPPDVAGWELGRGWFSTGSMLARMNFAAQLTTNQRFNLRDASREPGRTPEALLSYFVDRFSLAEVDGEVRDALLDYLRAGGAWTGADSQLVAKAAGLVHLILGAAEYQFV